MRFRWFGQFDVIVAAYVIGSVGLVAWAGLKINYLVIFDFRFDAGFLAIMGLYLWIMASVLAVRERLAERDAIICGPSWWGLMRSRALNLQIAWDALRLIVLIKLMFVVYSNIKQAIPRLHPRLFDEELYIIDRWAHLGWNPIDLTHAVFTTEASMLIMDWLYVAWYMTMAPVLAAFIFTERWHLRQSFFSCFFLLWIVGGLIAVAIPSLGPIFIEPATFDHIAMPRARELQEMLWENYQRAMANPEEYEVLLYEGIAAFPSLHVGLIALFAVFLFHLNRIAAWAMVAYTAVIQIGSVLLGWHYAVDGYATIILALALYALLRPRRSGVADNPDVKSEVSTTEPGGIPDVNPE